MARTETQSPALLSFFDRLSDDGPETSNHPQISQAQSLRLLKLAVVRDVMTVLNTRRSPGDAWSGSEDLNKSLLSYGLPDFTGLNPHNEWDINRVADFLKETITRFEPRLKNLRVHHRTTNFTENGIHYRISAVLDVQPEPQTLVFDTVLNIGHGSYSFQERI